MPENVKLKTKIDENQNYTLWVAKLPDMQVDAYCIINKNFDVVEMSTSVYPNAIKMLEALNRWVVDPSGMGMGDEGGSLPDFPMN